MKFFFVGGGSLGPVTPLLAVARSLQARRKTECIWVGTPHGPEAELIKAEGIRFFTLPVVKWPRYASFAWLAFPFRWFDVCAQAKRLLKEHKPEGIISMGGFTALPLIRAAKRLGIPCFTHQLDYEPGLTNRLLARDCVSVTTSFEYEQRPFGDKICDEPIATPVRYEARDLPPKEEAARTFGLNPHRPTVFIYGGGQGAQALNEHIKRTKDRWLSMAQVIHVTGPGKAKAVREKLSTGYATRQLLGTQNMAQAHALADLEIIRGGMGSLSEAAALKKAALVIPMPGSHQEANASAFEEQGAVMVFDQESPSFDDDLLTAARLLLHDPNEREAMGKKAHAFLKTDRGEALAERILHYYHPRHV